MACHRRCRHSPEWEGAQARAGGRAKRGAGCLGSLWGAAGTTLEMTVRTETQVSSTRGIWGLQCLAKHSDNFFLGGGGPKRPECHQSQIRPKAGMCEEIPRPCILSSLTRRPGAGCPLRTAERGLTAITESGVINHRPDPWLGFQVQ